LLNEKLKVETRMANAIDEGFLFKNQQSKFNNDCLNKNPSS